MSQTCVFFGYSAKVRRKLAGGVAIRTICLTEAAKGDRNLYLLEYDSEGPNSPWGNVDQNTGA